MMALEAFSHCTFLYDDVIKIQSVTDFMVT